MSRTRSRSRSRSGKRGQAGKRLWFKTSLAIASWSTEVIAVIVLWLSFTGALARFFIWQRLWALGLGFALIAMLISALAWQLGAALNSLRVKIYRQFGSRWTWAFTLVLALVVVMVGQSTLFRQSVNALELLTGGIRSARMETVAHQIYAGYRRLNEYDFRQIRQRSLNFSKPINHAARAFQIDPDILYGLAAVESSFIPRTSADGGRGLFQLTQVSKAAQRLAERKLQGQQVDDLTRQAFLAASMLVCYRKSMNGDFLLGLLVYNIGPGNTDLEFIRQHYQARDYLTAQPYLQRHPRFYPVKVLTYALAFRVWREWQEFLPYGQDNNAIRIQRLGIPGLSLKTDWLIKRYFGNSSECQ